MKKKKGEAKTKIPQSYEELFPGRFLKGVQFKGQAGMLTIQKVEKEWMDGEWAVLIYFEGIGQQLVLNKTNGECLMGMFGRTIGDWIGKRVTFYTRIVTAFGRTGPAVRVMGSPDLAKDMRINVSAGDYSGALTMKKTEAKRWMPVADDAEPEDDAEEFDPDTGETPMSESEKATIQAREVEIPF